MALALVAPALMISQIGEISEQSDGIQLHLTSLDPISKANAPDAWEAEALRRIDARLPAIVELIQGAAPAQLYIAPSRLQSLACDATGNRVMCRGRPAAAFPSTCQSHICWKFVTLKLSMPAPSTDWCP